MQEKGLLGLTVSGCSPSQGGEPASSRGVRKLVQPHPQSGTESKGVNANVLVSTLYSIGQDYWITCPGNAPPPMLCPDHGVT